MSTGPEARLDAAATTAASNMDWIHGAIADAWGPRATAKASAAPKSSETGTAEATPTTPAKAPEQRFAYSLPPRPEVLQPLVEGPGSKGFEPSAPDIDHVNRLGGGLGNGGRMVPRRPGAE